MPTLSRDIGPVRVTPAEIIPHLREIAEAVGEECTVATEDGACGIRLDYQAVDAEHRERWPYELTVWGVAWQETARRTPPFELASPAP